MLWTVEERGFLPSCDPLIQIPIYNYKNTQLIFALENLAHMMPCFLAERRWREEVIYELRQIASKFGPTITDKLAGSAELERAFLLFSMFANAYCFSYGDTPMQRLPKEIAVPLNRAAKACGRREILDYTAYVLYNWQQCDGKTEALVTFTDTHSEKELIKAFVAQEFDLAKMISDRMDSPVDYIGKWKTTLENAVARFRKVRTEMKIKEFDPLGEYYSSYNEEQECNPFAQSPMFSVLHRAFSAVDKDPLLQQSENDICNCRPLDHNQFIANIKPIASLVVDQATQAAYNECLQLFIILHRDMFMIKIRVRGVFLELKLWKNVS